MNGTLQELPALDGLTFKAPRTGLEYVVHGRPSLSVKDASWYDQDGKCTDALTYVEVTYYGPMTYGEHRDACATATVRANLNREGVRAYVSVRSTYWNGSKLVEMPEKSREVIGAMLLASFEATVLPAAGGWHGLARHCWESQRAGEVEGYRRDIARAIARAQEAIERAQARTCPPVVGESI